MHTSELHAVQKIQAIYIDIYICVYINMYIYININIIYSCNNTIQLFLFVFTPCSVLVYTVCDQPLCTVQSPSLRYSPLYCIQDILKAPAAIRLKQVLDWGYWSRAVCGRCRKLKCISWVSVYPPAELVSGKSAFKV